MNVINEGYLGKGAIERPSFAETASLMIQFVGTHRACFDLPHPIEAVRKEPKPTVIPIPTAVGRGISIVFDH